jgi:hypothetical protein
VANNRRFDLDGARMVDSTKEPCLFVFQPQGRQPSKRKQAQVRSHAARHGHRQHVKIATIKRGAGVHQHDGDELGDEPEQQSILPPILQSRHSIGSSEAPGSLTPLAPSSLRCAAFKGNGDPFASSMVTVDPVINRLLTFYREHHVPQQHWRRVDITRKTSYATTFFQLIVSALEDPCRGYAFLSGYASMLAAATNDSSLISTAFLFRAHAYQLLKRRLIDAGDKVPRNIAWTLYAFFTSAINAQDFAHAEIHGKALRDVVQGDTITQSATRDIRLLHSLLWQDMQRATLTLTRPLFDLRWFTMCLVTSPFFKFVWRSVRYSKTRMTTSMEAGVGKILAETSHLLRLTDGHTAGHFRLPKSSIRMIAARSLVLEGQLLNHYVDKTTALASVSIESRPRIYHNICVNLAGLYWLRRAGHHDGFRVRSLTPERVRNIYDSGPLIRQRMRHAIHEAGATEMESDPILFLWVLYVGSVIEQGQDYNNDGRHMWFNKAFARHCMHMGLLDWHEVEKILCKILYRAEISPKAEWYFRRLTMTDFALASSPTMDANRVDIDAIPSAEKINAEYQSPGGSTYMLSIEDEEDRITTELYDSVYGLFD